MVELCETYSVEPDTLRYSSYDKNMIRVSITKGDYMMVTSVYNVDPMKRKILYDKEYVSLKIYQMYHKGSVICVNISRSFSNFLPFFVNTNGCKQPSYVVSLSSPDVLEVVCLKTFQSSYVNAGGIVQEGNVYTRDLRDPYGLDMKNLFLEFLVEIQGEMCVKRWSADHLFGSMNVV